MSPLARAAGARAHRPGALHSPTLRAAVLIGALSTGTAVLLAACSTSANETASGGGAAHRAGRAPQAGLPAAAPSAAANGAGTTTRTRVVLSTQSIIYTAEITLRVKDVTITAATATGIATGAGGYVAGEEQNIPHHSNGTPTAILVLKIPVAAYHATLAKLEGLSGTLIHSSQHAQDVTQQVADVGSRVASAQAAIKQLRALLSKAGSVAALLQVQEEINAQESALEALIAQQQALLHQTSYGTVTVTLLGHKVKIVTAPKKNKASGGFGSGLRAGWHALVTVVRWLLTALGALLPFLIPAALLAAIAFEWRRRTARRRTPPAADPPATAQS